MNFKDQPIGTFLNDRTMAFTQRIRLILNSDLAADELEKELLKVKSDATIKPLELAFERVTIKKADSAGKIIADEDHASAIVFFIPVAGDLDLLYVIPTETSLTAYSTQLSEARNELIFSLNVLENNGKRIRQFFDNFEKSMKDNVRAQRKDIEAFNLSLNSIIVKERQLLAQKIETQKNLIRDIGFPLKRDA